MAREANEDGLGGASTPDGQQRVAVVVGGERGLDILASGGLADLGYRVIYTHRTDALVAERTERLPEVEVAVMDPSDDVSVREFFAMLRGDAARIDVLINAADAFVECTDDPVSEIGPNPLCLDADVLREGFERNVLCAFRTMQQAIPMMNAVGYGRVVNITNRLAAGGTERPGWPAYRISHQGLVALTRVFDGVAEENVKVNAVCPGWPPTLFRERAIVPPPPGEVSARLLNVATLDEDGPSGRLFVDGRPQ